MDLGGAADFETGQGCSGDEAIFDPVYGAPEQFIRAKSANNAVGGFGGLFGGGYAGGLTVGAADAVAAGWPLDAAHVQCVFACEKKKKMRKIYAHVRVNVVVLTRPGGGVWER